MKKILMVLGVISLVSCAKDGISNQKKVTQSCTNNAVAELVTNYGVIDIQLNSEQAPISTNNFISYVDSGFYKDKIFHRVIKSFMIQGGGFNAKMAEDKTNAPIKNEASNGLANDKYTIAMARTNDPNSATAQFFINTKNNGFLNKSVTSDGYAVFGKVVKGQDVVDMIENVKTNQLGPYSDVPVKPVIIKSAKMIKCN